MSHSNICPICQDSLNMYHTVLLGRCGHMFCEECWERFKEDHIKNHGMTPPKCPSCRSIIHIPSVIQKEQFIFTKEQLTHNLKEENQILKNKLIALSNKNRKELGEWKFQFRKFLGQSKEISYEESKSRLDIFNEYQKSVSEIHKDWDELNSYHTSMRKAMQEITKKYTDPSIESHTFNENENPNMDPFSSNRFGILPPSVNLNNYPSWYQFPNNLTSSFIIGSAALEAIRGSIPPPPSTSGDASDR